MYSKALGYGLTPLEFWDMSLQEVKDTVNSRYRQKNKEIHALSGMIRVAVLSVFPDSNVKFPSVPYGEEETPEENWKNSKNFMRALQEKRRGCK